MKDTLNHQNNLSVTNKNKADNFNDKKQIKNK